MDDSWRGIETSREEQKTGWILGTAKKYPKKTDFGAFLLEFYLFHKRHLTSNQWVSCQHKSTCQTFLSLQSYYFLTVCNGKCKRHCIRPSQAMLFMFRYGAGPK